MKRMMIVLAVLLIASAGAQALSLHAGAGIAQYYNFEELYTGSGLANANSGFYLDTSGATPVLTTWDGVTGSMPTGFYLGDNFGIVRVNTVADSVSTYYNDNNLATPGQELTGIFYGIDVISSTTVGSNVILVSTGGQLDLYNEQNPSGTSRFLTGVSTNVDYSPAKLGVSGGFLTFGPATEGTRVVSLAFADGITGTAGETVYGTFLGGFPSNGSASGYLNVILDGAPWAEQLDTDFFTSGLGTRDVLNQNSFFNTDQGANTVGGLHGWTLFSSDPLQFAATPEPGTLALLGLGLFGLGAVVVRRKRRS